MVYVALKRLLIFLASPEKQGLFEGKGAWGDDATGLVNILRMSGLGSAFRLSLLLCFSVSLYLSPSINVYDLFPSIGLFVKLSKLQIIPFRPDAVGSLMFDIQTRVISFKK